MFRIDRNLVKLSSGGSVQANAAHEKMSEDIPLSALSVEDIAAAAAMKEQAAKMLGEAEKKAAAIINNAEREAEKLRLRAEAELEGTLKSAGEKGYNEGADEARKALDLKIKEDDETLRSVIEVIQGERARIREELEGEIIKLTLAVTKKIINLASENDDTIFESIISNALKQMNLEGKLTIRVGVREYDRFFSSGSAVFTLGDGTTVTASVIKDPALGDMDCIIDSDGGTINAGVDSQIKLIQLAFDGAEQP